LLYLSCPGALHNMLQLFLELSYILFLSFASCHTCSMKLWPTLQVVPDGTLLCWLQCWADSKLFGAPLQYKCLESAQFSLLHHHLQDQNCQVPFHLTIKLSAILWIFMCMLASVLQSSCRLWWLSMSSSCNWLTDKSQNPCFYLIPCLSLARQACHVSATVFLSFYSNHYLVSSPEVELVAWYPCTLEFISFVNFVFGNKNIRIVELIEYTSIYKVYTHWSRW